MGTGDNNSKELQPQRVRANAYALLGRLLAAPPDAAMLTRLANIEPPPSADATAPLALHWSALRAAATGADSQGLEREYHHLFIGLGHGEVIPYASHHLTGFLNDRPLALLRGDLQALGFERQAGVCEPEDHVAALLEVMSLLAEVSAEDNQDKQTRFFERHIATWMPMFFADLASAPSARFYRAASRFGAAFLAIEGELLQVPTSRPLVATSKAQPEPY